MAGQNGLLFSKVPRHRSAVYLRIEQSSQLKQEFFIIFQCPLDGEQFTLAAGSVNPRMIQELATAVEFDLAAFRAQVDQKSTCRQ